MSKYADSLLRQRCAPEIARIIAKYPTSDESRIRLHLRDERHLHALTKEAERYWDAEVEEQMGARRGQRERPAVVESGSLFGGE